MKISQMAGLSVKDRLLETAARLFYRQGYNLTGINQILAESDAAIGSLYKHYPSKVDLLIAYLEKANEIYFSSLKTFTDKYKKPEDKLLAFFDFHKEFQQEGDFLGCNFMKINAEIARQEPKVEAIVQTHKKNVQTLLHEWVSALPQFKPKAPAKTADHVRISNLPRTSEIPKLSDLAKTAALLTDTIYLLFEGAMIDTTIQRNLHLLNRAREIVKNLI